MYDNTGDLSVLQSVGDGVAVYDEQVNWRLTSVQQDVWRLGYAEMFPTSYQWRAVFEAERGDYYAAAQ